MPPGLDEQLAIERDRIGPWRATIGRSTGFGSAHGGLLAALALRALQTRLDESPLPPRSLTLRYLERTRPETVELTVDVERSGGSSVAASVSLHQEGAVTCIGHGLFGADRDSPAHLGATMPTVPPPEECALSVDGPPPEAEVDLPVDYRPAAPPLPLSGGDRAEILVWMRLSEERALDVAAATLLADACAPALYGKLTHFILMPSAEISFQYCDLAGLADGPWLLGAFRTLFAGAGYAFEDAELWSPSGRLVLLSRQVRRILVR